MTLGPPQRFCRILISRLICAHHLFSDQVSSSMQDRTVDAELAHLLLLYWLQDLYDALLVVNGVYALKDLAVFSSAHFAHHFIVVLVPMSNQTSSYCKVSVVKNRICVGTTGGPGNLPPLNREGFIVPVVLWPSYIYISVDAGTAHHSALISDCFAVFNSGHKPLSNYFSLHTSDLGPCLNPLKVSAQR